MLTTGQLMVRGAGVAVGAILLGAATGALRRGPAARGDQPPAGPAAVVAEIRAMAKSLTATQGELAVARLELARADEIIAYSTHYVIPANVAADIYDIALSEGLDPALAFRLVQVESRFQARATSPAGAVGYTQILPSTARLYEPGLTFEQLYERPTNLRLGFRYLHDLLERFAGAGHGRLRLALLAYNRGPARVDELLSAGHDPRNGYEAAVMAWYRPNNSAP